jgi:hypothetical protein
MKKIGILLLVLFSLSLYGEFIEVLSSTAANLTMKVELDEPFFSKETLPDQNLYDKIIIPGAAQNLPGLPDLPIFGNWILVPNGSDLDISVSKGTPQIFDSINLAPVQQQKPDLVDAPQPAFIKNNLVYQENTSFPGKFAEIEAMKKKRGQDCTILWIYPYQYNPLTKQVYYYPDLQISIDFIGGGEPIPSNLYNQDQKEFWTRLAINGNEIIALTEDISENNTTNNYRDEGCDLLIITHPVFIEAAQILATWKRQKAFMTKVVSLDETGYETEAIDAFINNAAANWDPAPLHIILLGDAEFLPTWYVTEHPYGDGGQGYTAADVYYADIDDPHDLVADMGFGRIPVNTPQEAMSFVNKIIQYEQNPPIQSNFYNNATCAAYFQDAGEGYAERRFAKTSEDVRNFLTENFFDVERIYFTEPETYPLYWNTYAYVFENDYPGEPIPDEIRKPQFPWNGNDDDINNAVNNGTFFILHRDHGYRLGWGEPAYSVYNLPSVNNGNLLPVIWTINCNTGWFDNETDAAECGTGFDSESFVERFMNHNNGGTIGMIGSTRVSYSGNNDRLVWGFMDAIWPEFLNWCTAEYPDHEPIYRMGDVVNYGKEYFMANSTYGGEVRTTTLEQFLWFGDPTTEMWTAQPQDLVVTHDSEFALGATVFEVFCEVENADAALILNDKVISRGKITGGSVLLNFLPVTQMGELKLAVSAHNYIPTITDIEIIPTGPYVICETVDFIEAGDYIDGSIQALDIIDITLNLNNIGIEATEYEILITLETDSEFIEILNGTAVCPVIDDSTTYTLENAFQIELLPGLQDSSFIDFILDMQSAQNSWPGAFQLQVHAPVLEFEAYTLSYLEEDDGILDPGETAEISFEFSNSGSGFSYDVFTTLTSNDPYIQISGLDYIEQIDPGATSSSSCPIILQISPDCPVDYHIELSLLTFDNQGSFLMRDFSLPVGLLLYNFDDGAGIWQNENLGEEYLNEWHLSSYRNATPNGEYSMKCGGINEEFYSNNVFAALYTPVFQSVPGTFLRFTHWLNTGIIANTQSWDGGILEISVNGEEFFQIEPVAGYPATIINLDVFPFAGGTPVFAGDIDWEEVEVDLTDFPGEVQLRFVFGSSPTMYTMEGWYIDDVQIVNYTDSDENEIIPAATSLAQNHPNPFNPETTISFSLVQEGPVLLEIFNIKGQKIKTLLNDVTTPGIHNLIWQGKDDNNHPVSSGVYFYRLNTVDFSKIKKMILIK